MQSLSVICLLPGTDLCTRAVELFETLATQENELTFQVQAQCRLVTTHVYQVATQVCAVERHSDSIMNETGRFGDHCRDPVLYDSQTYNGCLIILLPAETAGSNDLLSCEPGPDEHSRLASATASG